MTINLLSNPPIFETARDRHISSGGVVSPGALIPMFDTRLTWVSARTRFQHRHWRFEANCTYFGRGSKCRTASSRHRPEPMEDHDVWRMVSQCRGDSLRRVITRSTERMDVPRRHPHRRHLPTLDARAHSAAWAHSGCKHRIRDGDILLELRIDRDVPSINREWDAKLR